MDRRLRLILLQVALVAAFASLPAAPALPSVHVPFNLATETYDQFYRNLHRQLIRPSSPPYNPTDVFQRYVLGKRRPKFVGAPLGWFMVDVVAPSDDGSNEEMRTTLALANDDIYLLGFANRTGYWHIVKGGFSGLPSPLTTLSIADSYTDLVGGYENLDQVDLGKQSAIEAARTLASYNTATTTDAQLKQAFSRFTMMISEAMRFSVIRNTFMERWEQKSNIKKDQTKYVVYWGRLSKALVRWKQSNYNHWPPESSRLGSDFVTINVKSPTDALDLLDVLLRPIDE